MIFVVNNAQFREYVRTAKQGLNTVTAFVDVSSHDIASNKVNSTWVNILAKLQRM